MLQLRTKSTNNNHVSEMNDERGTYLAHQLRAGINMEMLGRPRTKQPDAPCQNTRKDNSPTMIIDEDDDEMRAQDVSAVRKRRGRPPGSRNKSSRFAQPASRRPQTRTSTQSHELDDHRDTDIADLMDDDYVPRSLDTPTGNVLDISQLSPQEAEQYGAWVPSDRFERQACPELSRAYRKGVCLYTQLNETMGPFTKNQAESKVCSTTSHHGYPTEATDPAQEQALSVAWDSSLTRAAIERSSTHASEISAVWKVSFHRFGLDPLSLLSMYHDIEFENENNESFLHQGEMKRNPLWTHNFCEKFKRIMAHPIFSSTNAHRFIPIVIRWAIMCRTHDQRGFSEAEQRILNHVRCGGLGHPTDAQPISMRFYEHQTQLKRDGLFMTPHAELLLRIIDHTGTPERFILSGIVQVRTRDLGVVIKALDSLSSHGMNVTCETHFQVYCASRISRGYPSGVQELLEAYKRSWMSLQKRMLREAEQNPRQSEPINAVLGQHLRTSQARNDISLDNNGHVVQGMLGGHDNSNTGLGSGETPDEEHQPSLDYRHSPHSDQSRYSSRNRLASEEGQASQPEIIEIGSSEDECNAPGCMDHEAEHPSRDFGLGGNDGQDLAFYNTDDMTITGDDNREDQRPKAAATGNLSQKRKRNRNSSQRYRWRKNRNNNRGGQNRHMSSGVRTTGNAQRAWNPRGQHNGPAFDPPTAPRVQRENTSWRQDL